jgi:hypothetical protein
MIENKDIEEISGESLGLKLDPKKSMFAKKTPKPVDFDEKAKEAHAGSEDKKIRGFELSREFLTVFQSKILTINKGPQEKAAEKEAINKLIAWAIEMNTDQMEKEGIGSVGLITLLFNCILKMRDSVNSLEHKLSEAEKQLAQLQVKDVQK